MLRPLHFLRQNKKCLTLYLFDMRSFLKIKLFAVLLMAVLLVIACKKKEIPGPQGEPGKNGTGGNSNTTSSAVFPITNSQWVSDGGNWTATYSSTLITKDVVDKGSLKLYVDIGGSWWELPYAEGDLLTQCGFSEGKVRLVHGDIHGGLPFSAPPTRNYRLVTVVEAARTANKVSESSDLNFSHNATW
jgi:hypothetical protein